MTKDFHKLLSSKKGVAIEMAILVMVITFSFSVMITTTALLHHDKMIKAEKELAETIAIEQIAKDFCANAGSGNNAWVLNYPDYNIEVDALNLTVKPTDSEEVLLRVSLQNDNGTYRILVWETQ